MENIVETEQLLQNMEDLDTETILVNVFGDIYTYDQFVVEFGHGDETKAEIIFDILAKKGQAKLIEEKESKVQKRVAKALTENKLEVLAEHIEDEEEYAKDKAVELKRKNRLTYESIEVPFNSTMEATEFQNKIKKSLRLKDTSIRNNDGDIFLIIYNITDKEVDKINKMYQAEKITKGSVELLDKGLTGATKTVNYAAVNVLAPVAKTAAKGILSLARTAATTLVKTGASVITTTKEGVKDTVEAVSTDKDVIKASRDILDLKDGLKRKVFQHTTGSLGSGKIKINK